MGMASLWHGHQLEQLGQKHLSVFCSSFMWTTSARIPLVNVHLEKNKCSLNFTEQNNAQLSLKIQVLVSISGIATAKDIKDRKVLCVTMATLTIRS